MSDFPQFYHRTKKRGQVHISATWQESCTCFGLARRREGREFHSSGAARSSPPPRVVRECLCGHGHTHRSTSRSVRVSCQRRRFCSSALSGPPVGALARFGGCGPERVRTAGVRESGAGKRRTEVPVGGCAGGLLADRGFLAAHRIDCLRTNAVGVDTEVRAPAFQSLVPGGGSLWLASSGTRRRDLA